MSGVPYFLWGRTMNDYDFFWTAIEIFCWSKLSISAFPNVFVFNRTQDAAVLTGCVAGLSHTKNCFRRHLSQTFIS